MSRSDHRPSAGYLQQEAIVASMEAGRACFCVHCRKPATSRLLTLFPTCLGYGCRACKTEGFPVATLDAEGRVVRTDPWGKPTGEVLS